MRNITFLFLIFIFFQVANLSAQHTAYPEEETHQQILPFRAAILIGHTLIPAEHAGSHFFIPSWGFDLEYWRGPQWGVGLHSDIEIESFIIRNNGEEELESINPLVITLDALYKPWKELVFQAGPGIEFEKDDNYRLMRVGLEYEFEIAHHWDVCPTVFYDARLDGYHTWSVALGIGRPF